MQKTVARWADYAGLGNVTPHDLRRTAITEMLKTYPVQEALMASNHRDVQTLMGHGRDHENLERNPSTPSTTTERRGLFRPGPCFSFSLQPRHQPTDRVVQRLVDCLG